jgi:transcriptional regulator with XRE-family HTH domain
MHLKEMRTKLNFSQEYVARLMNVNRSVITAIESGKRSVSAEELDQFSAIYGVSMEMLLHGEDDLNHVRVFNRMFDALSETDQQEIHNLMQFKINLKRSLASDEP